MIDGEAIVIDQKGLSVFDLLRYRCHDHAATLCAFDLIEVEGWDPRRQSIEEHKRLLGKLLQKPHHGITVNEVFTGKGSVIYKHTCELGCEGIVSKRLGSAYRMGRTDAWIKTKNPLSPAAARTVDGLVEAIRKNATLG